MGGKEIKHKNRDVRVSRGCGDEKGRRGEIVKLKEG